MYLNGVKQAETESGVNRGTQRANRLTIGAHSDLGNNIDMNAGLPFKGAVDQLSVYSTALSAAQVAELYISDKRYVEVFDERYLLDCCVAYNGAYATTLTGLSFWKGKTVQVKNGEEFIGDFVVDSTGTITLPKAYMNLYAGIPYSSTAKTMPPVAAPLLKKNYTLVGVRCDRMRDLQVGNNLVTFMTPDSEIQQAPPAFTGNKIVEALGADYDAQITLLQERPYGGKILSVSGVLEVGNP
jgi:hypothetical protein